MNLGREIRASANETVDRYQMRPESISELDYATIAPGFGKKIWAAILFVDLRNSSKMAELFPERTVYITMHAILTALAWLVHEYKGLVVGYRGDGLFAAFGLNNQDTAEQTAVDHVRSSISCGKAMLDAIDSSIRPALEGILDTLPPIQLGVGIDANDLVVTRIGLVRSTELTAYGSPVNMASKLCGNETAYDKVAITRGAFSVLPKTKEGRWSFMPRGNLISHDWGIIDFSSAEKEHD